MAPRGAQISRTRSASTLVATKCTLGLAARAPPAHQPAGESLCDARGRVRLRAKLGCAPQAAANSRSAPWSAHTRPGDGPVRDELWGRTVPDDYLHDKKQNHKPLHGVQRHLDSSELASHAYGIEADPRRLAEVDANMEIGAMENSWGTKVRPLCLGEHGGR